MIALLIFAAAWLAFLVSAIAGGGAGLVMVPLLRLIVPIASVPAALSIGTAASSVSRILLFRSSVRWDMVRRFLPTALPAAALGAWLLTRFQPAYVELLISFFLLANLPALFRRKVPGQAVASPLSPRLIPWLGLGTGMLSGFTGAVGLLFNNAYQRLGMTREEIVATRATNEVLLHLLKIAIYLAFGLLTAPALAAGVMIGLAALLASLTTRWVLPHMREALFRTIGHGAMVAAGAAMFMLSGNQIAALHQAWFETIAPGGERELVLYWGGQRRYSVEAEPEGYLAFERVIPLAALPQPLRHQALAAISRRSITLVEEVRTHRGRGYEIYFISAGRPHKMELDAARITSIEPV